MSVGSVNFTTHNVFPLNHSILFDRPYLSIIRNHQKKKKPQFSKLSILTKTSIGSTKVTSNQYKKTKKSKQNEKNLDQKPSCHYISVKDNRKNRSNSYENRMTKTVKQIEVEQLGLSCEPDYFERASKQTPLSRTVCKKNEGNSIFPLYSSLIFNQVQQNASPDAKQKSLKSILDRTFNVLTQYKQECKELRRQRDYFKKKYHKTNSKLKKLEGQRGKSKS